MYKKFNESYQIPFNLLEIIKKDKYFNYFNTDNEKDEYMNKWNSKSVMTIFEPYSLESYNFYKELSKLGIFYKPKLFCFNFY